MHTVSHETFAAVQYLLCSVSLTTDQCTYISDQGNWTWLCKFCTNCSVESI